MKKGDSPQVQNNMEESHYMKVSDQTGHHHRYFIIYHLFLLIKDRTGGNFVELVEGTGSMFHHVL